MTIKDFTIKTSKGTKYIELAEISKKFSKRRFKEWSEYFIGQTGILVKGKMGIYPYDLARFFNGLSTLD